MTIKQKRGCDRCDSDEVDVKRRSGACEASILDENFEFALSNFDTDDSTDPIDELESDAKDIPVPQVTPRTIPLAIASPTHSPQARIPVEEGCEKLNVASSSVTFSDVDSIPPPPSESTGKYTIVFDLDETLVYARTGTIMPRPHLDTLFSTLKGRAEVLIWTAGVTPYAQRVLESIDKVSCFHHCICRHEAWYQQPCNAGKNYVKDLRLLGRDVERTIIIENTPDCVVKNPRNSIIVSDYTRENLADVTMAIIARVLDGLVESNMSVPEYLASDMHLKLEHLRNAAGETLSVFMIDHL